MLIVPFISLRCGIEMSRKLTEFCDSSSVGKFYGGLLLINASQRFVYAFLWL
jgi:hypothetical protein